MTKMMPNDAFLINKNISNSFEKVLYLVGLIEGDTCWGNTVKCQSKQLFPVVHWFNRNIWKTQKCYLSLKYIKKSSSKKTLCKRVTRCIKFKNRSKKFFLEHLNKEITDVNFANFAFYLIFQLSRKYEISCFSVNLFFLWRDARP